LAETKESGKIEQESKELKKYRDLIEKTLKKDLNIYEQYRRELLPIIDKLEQDLREIFVARRTGEWLSGFKIGKRIDIKKRIQEKAKEISVVESKAWQKRELPSEKDYAITLLNDLSGSMRGEKIQEDFKAKIVISEVLNRLSVNTEILGFNDRIYEYQKFGENMSQEIRENMGGILEEVRDFSDTGKANWNDDGWALEQASERLNKQRAKEKFLIVLSDGLPEESSMHPRSQFELSKIVDRVLKETNQKLIGIGIGPGTKHVEKYYPNSIANVSTKELSEKLAGLIREVIANYDKF
ncbi:MAG: VWA domain-containing protein, partial [Patescibacteria group bacterium]|nr:VWA domain-containing protein [Patescibacteria group bacterium]